MRRLFLSLLLMVLPGLGFANDFERISEKDRFLSLIEGKELRIGLYNLSLRVTPDGKITGKALGWGISGQWKWEDGHFCRDMDWSGYAIPFNCQLVEARGAGEMRFTSDRGTGDSALFRLR